MTRLERYSRIADLVLTVAQALFLYAMTCLLVAAVTAVVVSIIK